jgi:hypothetical protein
MKTLITGGSGFRGNKQAGKPYATSAELTTKALDAPGHIGA